MRRGPLGLIEIVKDARTRQTDKEAFNLLVLVDQFEELFTYVEAGGRQADEAEAFINLLLAPRIVPDARIYIVLTMRTDFLGNCVRFLDLPDAINRAQYLTPRLTREQIERAITCPAHLFDGDVEATLVTELINAVSNDPDQLPILQHALARMWDKARQRDTDTSCITWDDFKAVGGISNALSNHADELLAALSSRNKIEEPLCPEQQAAEILFRAITDQRSSEAGGQAVRRPQSLDLIAAWSGRKWEEFKPVVKTYAKEGVNFLHYNGELGEKTVVDISHEALIRQWKLLRHWVTQEARLASEFERFRNCAEDSKNGSGALLTGAGLARALEWRDGCRSQGSINDVWQPNSAWANRYRKSEDTPSDTEFNEVLKFIDDSHAVVLNAERRERNVKRVLITLIVLSGITTIGAFGFALQSHNNQVIAEAALLWTPLDFSTPIVNITKKQANGLLKLELANDSRKRVFFDQLMKDQTLAERFINNPEVIMTAMAGISPTQKNELFHRLDDTPHNNSDIFRLTRFLVLDELKAKILGDDIISAIEIKDSKDLAPRKILGQRIKTLIGKMTEADSETMTTRFLATFRDTTVDYESDPRAKGLAAIIERTPETKLGWVADQLVATIKASYDPIQLKTLKGSLVEVAAKMQDEQQTGALAKQLFTAMKEAQLPGQFETFGKGLKTGVKNIGNPVRRTDRAARQPDQRFE